jgi:predicted lipid carrier protein YhbT
VATVQIVVGAEVLGVHHVEDGSDAEVVLTAVAPVAAELASGALDPNVAYMQGRLKTAGDQGALLRVLPHLDASLWVAAPA